jgi:transposase
MRKARSPADLGFTGHDRRRLATALHQAQEAKVYQRVQAALLIAQGYSVDEVARIIGSRQRSVYYWMRRYLDHHRVSDLYDAPRTGRPRTAAQITTPCILRELARHPLKLGYNTTNWTAPSSLLHIDDTLSMNTTAEHCKVLQSAA